MGFLSGMMGGMGGMGGGAAAGGMSGPSSGDIIGGSAKATGQILGSIHAYNQAGQAEKYYAANARNAMAEAENRAWYQRETYGRLASSQRAGYGASGVDVNVGSPLDVIADTDAQGVVASLAEIYAGKMEKLNWDLQKKAAKQQKSNALFGLLTTLADPLDWSKMSTMRSSYYSAGGGGTFLGGSGMGG